MQKCNIVISNIRVHDYSLMIKNAIMGVKEISIFNIEKDGFDNWIPGKMKLLSISDLSSLYVAVCNVNSILVLTPDDVFLEDEARLSKITYINFDDLMLQMVKDEKITKLYELIKAA
jgi:hypothetical protein